jgi:hypothetical protein
MPADRALAAGRRPDDTEQLPVLALPTRPEPAGTLRSWMRAIALAIAAGTILLALLVGNSATGEKISSAPEPAPRSPVLHAGLPLAP